MPRNRVAFNQNKTINIFKLDGLILNSTKSLHLWCHFNLCQIQFFFIFFRDHPSVIKRRFFSVFVMTLLSPLSLYFGINEKFYQGVSREGHPYVLVPIRKSISICFDKI